MLETLKNLKNLVAVCGHFGSGKTNFAVNLAKAASSEGRSVTLVDLDIVNPYFRAADNVAELEALGVRCVVPDFANTNVDIPSLPPSVMGALETASREPDRLTIIDVGGDNGAVALGMYDRYFREGMYDMLYVVNKYRPLTEDAESAMEILREIEWIGRIRATGIVNNSNMGAETIPEHVASTTDFANELSAKCGLKVVCTCADVSLKESLDTVPNMFFITNATKQIF